MRALAGVLRVGLVEFFGAFDAMFFAVGDEQQVFGAGEADVEQAAVFVVFLCFYVGFDVAFGFVEGDADAPAVAVAPGFDARAVVTAAAYAAGGEDGNGGFEAFGFVDGEQAHGVVAG